MRRAIDPRCLLKGERDHPVLIANAAVNSIEVHEAPVAEAAATNGLPSIGVLGDRNFEALHTPDKWHS